MNYVDGAYKEPVLLNLAERGSKVCTSWGCSLRVAKSLAAVQYLLPAQSVEGSLVEDVSTPH